MSNSLKWMLVLVGLALPLAAVVAERYFHPAIPVIESTNHDDAIYFAKQIVLKLIRNPDKATFPEDGRFHVEHLGGDTWKVSSYVGTINGVNTPVQMPWAVTIERTGDRWTLIEREMNFNALTDHVRDKSWTNHLQKQKWP
jgi:hypothetical protein